MTMTAGWRKATLTAHVITSVGWLGAVAAFLALALVGLTSASPARVQGAYVAAAVVTWMVIVPLCLASLVTGVVQSLGTPWGLFRHYWVVVKLALTVVATVLLLVHTQPIDHLADSAAGTTTLGAELRGVQIQLLADAAAALVVLLATTALATFKPRGMTRYGQRRARGSSEPPLGPRVNEGAPAPSCPEAPPGPPIGSGHEPRREETP